MASNPWEKYAAPSTKSEVGPWTKFSVPQSNESYDYDNPLAAAALGAGEQLTLGYLPELKAAGEVGIEKVKNVFGDTSPDVGYEESKKKFGSEIEKYKKYNPKSFTAGQVGGVIGSIPLTGGLLGKAIPALARPAAGILGRIGQGAASGAIQSAAYNPGEREEGEDLLQVEKRLGAAKTGALFGAGGQLGGEAIGKGLQSLKALPGKLESAGLSKAFKSSGAMLKDFRAAGKKNVVDQLGKTMLDEGLAKPGMTFSDVMEKSRLKVDDVGQKIGAIYDDIGFRPQVPSELGDRLTQTVVESMPRQGKEAFTQKLGGLIEEVVNDPDVIKGDVRAINEHIGEISDKINWGKANSELPEIQKGYKALRKNLRGLLNDIADQSGSPQLKDLNKKYGNLVEINTIAKDRVARESANQMFGLSDKILGGMVGVSSAAADGNVSVEDVGKGLLLGLGGAAASKAGRLYGAPLVTRGLLGASKVGGKLGGMLPDVVQNKGAELLRDPRMQALSRIEAEKNKK